MAPQDDGPVNYQEDANHVELTCESRFLTLTVLVLTHATDILES